MPDIVDATAYLIYVDDEDLLEWFRENNHKVQVNHMTSDRCRSCGYSEIGLGGLVQSDGRIAIKAYCARCHRSQGGALKVPEKVRNVIGILIRKRHAPCEVEGCGNAYSQSHHVLPHCVDRELSWRYPTINLCEFHHRLWHDLTGIGTGRSK